MYGSITELYLSYLIKRGFYVVKGCRAQPRLSGQVSEGQRVLSGESRVRELGFEPHMAM